MSVTDGRFPSPPGFLAKTTLEWSSRPAAAQATENAVSGQTIWFSLDGIEYESWVPAGRDRWDHVAEAVGLRRRTGAVADGIPSYDTGTRTWTLIVQLGTGRRKTRLQVPLRWNRGQA